MDPILDTGFLNVPSAQASREVESMSHNGSQNNETSCSFTDDFCCFQDETELLNRHCRTSSTECSSNSQFLVTNLHLFHLTWLIFCSSVCNQS